MRRERFAERCALAARRAHAGPGRDDEHLGARRRGAALGRELARESTPRAASSSASAALVGAASLAVSPRYLATVDAEPRSAASAAHAHYYAALLVFWAALLALPLAGEPRRRLAADRGDDRRVGAARRLLAASARALEAAWKYLVLTSLGLGIALLGISCSCRSRSAPPAARRARLT